jgi:hypothetical protein
MGLFSFKKTKQIDVFAQFAADHLFSYVQPDVAKEYFGGAQQKAKKKQQRQVEQELRMIIGEFRRFTDKNSLGIYGKARLQQQFGERLRELGYDATVASRLVEIMLLGNA